MDKRTISFRDWGAADIAAPPTGDAVFLVDLTYGPAVNGSRLVELEGITFGSASVEVGVEIGDTTVVGPAIVGAAGLFHGTLTIPNGSGRAGVARVSNRDNGTAGHDRAAFTIGDGFVELPAHHVQTVLADRLRYAAGSPDRLQFSRTFVKIEPDPNWLKGIGGSVFGSDEAGYFRFDGQKIIREVEAYAAKARAKVEAGELSLTEYRRLLGSRLRASVAAGLVKAPANVVAMVKQSRKRRQDWIASNLKRDQENYGPRGRRQSRRARPSRSSALSGGTQKVVVVDVPRNEVEEKLAELAEKARAWAEAHLRLGVLFHERVRIRPTNQVLGEQIYQLALTPGEEVQIRQTSDTKRRTAFLEIKDQEAERETSFSSTWSTDMASTIASQTSFQQSTDIGSGVSGDAPEVPLSVSSTIAINTTSANSDSSGSTLAFRRERTESASAKMRQQHRVQIEVAVEDNQSLGTSRTLRNLNQQRSVLHTFYKMYRKEQVTLERWDAQLCVRLVVDDPARVTRGTFLVNLEKIDPARQAWRNIVAPAGTPREAEFDVYPSADDGGMLHGVSAPRAVTKQIDLRVDAGVGAELWLTAPPKFVMTECGLAFYGDANLTSTVPDDGSDPDIVSEAELTDDIIPHVRVGWQFVNNGGKVRWVHEPEVRSETATCTLALELPIHYTAPTTLLGEPESEITHVRFRVETAWGPSDQTLADYLTRVEDERIRLSKEFDASMVKDLYDVAEADYPKTVVDRALAETLTYPPDFQYRLVQEIFDLPGVVIDNVPYWATPQTRAAHDELLLRLQRLPVQLPLETLLSDCLTAAQAIVYLPIRRGMEEQALELLPESAGKAAAIAESFHTFWKDHYGPLAEFVAPDVASHMAPTPVLATKADAQQWTNKWEDPQNRFEILGQWSELVPTDGVHVESHLSSTVVTDENEQHRLEQSLRGD
jgi:hypothetical protein